MPDSVASQEIAPGAERLGRADHEAVPWAGTLATGTVADARTLLVTLIQVTFSRAWMAVGALFVICPLATSGSHCDAVAFTDWVSERPLCAPGR